MSDEPTVVRHGVSPQQLDSTPRYQDLESVDEQSRNFESMPARLGSLTFGRLLISVLLGLMAALCALTRTSS